MTTAWLLPIVPWLAAIALFAAGGGALRARIDLAATVFTSLVAAGLLIWPEEEVTTLRPDRLAVVAALIAAIVAILSRWQALARVRQAAPRRIGGQVALGGMLLAMLAADPASRWIGMTVAVAAVLATRPPRERADTLPLAAAGLGLSLFGVMTAASGPPLLAAGCLLMGGAAVVAMAPVLVPALPVLLVRFRAEAFGGQAGTDGSLLIAIGLVGALACAWLTWGEPRAARRDHWAVLGVAGLGTAAVGLGSPEGVFAGVILLLLLPLAQQAVALASRDGMDRWAAGAGLVGLPPLGVFPGLMMVVFATGRQAPWLLPLMILAVVGIGWGVVSRLTPRPAWGRLHRSSAWIPIGLALLIGLALPRDVGAWLYAALPVAE